MTGPCGDVACAARVAVMLADPSDRTVTPPCDRCAGAAAAALLEAQADLLRSARSADCHTVGPG